MTVVAPFAQLLRHAPRLSSSTPAVRRSRIKAFRFDLSLDRNCSFGHSGVFFQEIKAALYNEAIRPAAFGFVTGLGGRDVGPELIRQMFDYAMEHDVAPSASVWMGVNP